MDMASKVSDNCITMVTEFCVELCNTIEEDVGQRPTLDDFCDVLTWGLKSCSADLFDDINTSLIQQITCKVKKRHKQKLIPGDIVAVPAGESTYYYGIYITSNTFGHAYGFFRGTRPLAPINDKATLVPVGIPVYSGRRAVDDGRWQIVGHESELLTCFPKEPEIYHKKKHHLNNDAIGEYGAAENANNVLRNIDRDEAQEVGLLNGSYTQGYLEEYISAWCQKWCEVSETNEPDGTSSKKSQ